PAAVAGGAAGRGGRAPQSGLGLAGAARRRCAAGGAGLVRAIDDGLKETTHVPELPPGHGMAAYLVRPGPRLRADGCVLLRRPVGVRPRDRPLGAAGHALRAAAHALVRTGAAAGVRAPAAGSGPGRGDAPAGGWADAGTLRPHRLLERLHHA